jgi:hypothetical protein
MPDFARVPVSLLAMMLAGCLSAARPAVQTPAETEQNGEDLAASAPETAGRSAGIRILGPARTRG